MTKPISPWPGQVHWPYTVAELWADGVIHAVGVTLAIVGAVSLIALMPKSSTADVVGVAVYLATLIASIVASAAYNVWPESGFKWLLRRFDHSAIYLLIAGTYTPFMLRLGTAWLLSTVWLVATVGVIVKVMCPGRFDRLSIGLYLALGWSGVVVLDKLRAELSSSTLLLIGGGGLVYSFGVVFHLWERLRFQNAIWHGFVLTAASIHYAAVWSAVGPPAVSG